MMGTTPLTPLEPCNCGEKKPREGSRKDDDGFVYYRIECPACGEQTDETIIQNEAILLWNTANTEVSEMKKEYMRLCEEFDDMERERREIEMDQLGIESRINEIEEKAKEMGVKL